MQEETKLLRIRMLSAIGDFQLALSAADFGLEANEDERYTIIELRRFRCFEHTAIVSYARPFSQSKGSIPKLSLKRCGVYLSESEKELHDKVIKLRNKLVAHSDVEMMNFASKACEISETDDISFIALAQKFDEGLQFYQIRDRYCFVDLIRKISFGLYNKLREMAQSDPQAFDINMHYPQPK